MPENRYAKLLGVEEEVLNPDYYQLLQLNPAEPLTAEAIEAQYKSQMAKLQHQRSTKYKDFIEFLKGELKTARRTLTESKRRAAYDRDRRAEALDELREIVEMFIQISGDLSEVEIAEIHSRGQRMSLSPAEIDAQIDRLLRDLGGKRVQADDAMRVRAERILDLRGQSGSLSTKAVAHARQAAEKAQLVADTQVIEREAIEAAKRDAASAAAGDMSPPWKRQAAAVGDPTLPSGAHDAVSPHGTQDATGHDGKTVREHVPPKHDLKTEPLPVGASLPVSGAPTTRGRAGKTHGVTAGGREIALSLDGAPLSAGAKAWRALNLTLLGIAWIALILVIAFVVLGSQAFMRDGLQTALPAVWYRALYPDVAAAPGPIPPANTAPPTNVPPTRAPRPLDRVKAAVGAGDWPAAQAAFTTLWKATTPKRANNPRALALAAYARQVLRPRELSFAPTWDFRFTKADWPVDFVGPWFAPSPEHAGMVRVQVPVDRAQPTVWKFGAPRKAAVLTLDGHWGTSSSPFGVAFWRGAPGGIRGRFVYTPNPGRGGSGELLVSAADDREIVRETRELRSPPAGTAFRLTLKLRQIHAERVDIQARLEWRAGRTSLTVGATDVPELNDAIGEFGLWLAPGTEVDLESIRVGPS